MSMIRAAASLVVLPLEYAYDFFRACRWSKASPASPKDKRMYYDIILLAHTVEKGLSQPSPRPGFGKAKISSLLDSCSDYAENWDPFPIEKTYGALLAYVEWHQANGLEMGVLGARILSFIADCEKKHLIARGGTKELSPEKLNAISNVNGVELLEGRYSCRRFKDEIVDRAVVNKAVSIAQRAPSQCNRQSARLHCYQNPTSIHNLLTLQRGAAGFAHNVKNLFVITSEMTAWSGCNARNQCFVDGSLFAMQLSLACSSLGLGSCALNLAVGNLREKQIRIAGGIPHSERLILMMAFGYPASVDEPLIVAKSERTSLSNVVRFY